ncbi:MAG: uracil-DNA glycosylase family protein [Thermoleophilia bacterium]
MSTVTIEVDGVELETLAELLRPGLRAVVVGLNPSNVSVNVGHYFQGRLGLRLWQRLQQAGILHSLPRGGEDDEAFRQGIGFADVVRVPSHDALWLTPAALRLAGPDLCDRLLLAGVRPPTTVVFVFAKAFAAVGPLVRERGYEVLRMPGPYAPADQVAEELAVLGRVLGVADCA